MDNKAANVSLANTGAASGDEVVTLRDILLMSNRNEQVLVGHISDNIQTPQSCVELVLLTQYFSFLIMIITVRLEIHDRLHADWSCKSQTFWESAPLWRQ